VSVEKQYKYEEDRIIQEFVEYVNSTYSQHYSMNQFQATEFIIDSGHGEGFCLGNIMKYAQRFGKKEGKNKKDLFKIMHYALLAIYDFDQERLKQIQFETMRAQKIEENPGWQRDE
jgi:hypothetical protein